MMRKDEARIAEVERNRRLMERFVVDATAVALAEDVTFCDQAQGETFNGRSAAATLLRAFYVEGFPGAQVEVQALVVDETAAVLEFTFYGRQQGPFFGIPATGRTVTVPMVLVCRIARGQIQQAALYYDAGTLLRQLGLAL